MLSCMRCNTFLEHRIVRDDVQYFPSLALHQFTCNHKEVGQCFSVSSVWQQVVCTARYAVFSCMSHVSCIYTEVSIFLSLCYQFGSKSCAARCVFSFLLYLHGCVFRRNSLSFFSLIDLEYLAVSQFICIGVKALFFSVTVILANKKNSLYHFAVHGF